MIVTVRVEQSCDDVIFMNNEVSDVGGAVVGATSGKATFSSCRFLGKKTSQTAAVRASLNRCYVQTLFPCCFDSQKPLLRTELTTHFPSRVRHRKQGGSAVYTQYMVSSFTSCTFEDNQAVRRGSFALSCFSFYCESAPTRSDMLLFLLRFFV